MKDEFEASEVLGCRLKKGFVALMVDGAGLTTGGGLEAFAAAAAAARVLVSSSMLLFSSSASAFSFSRSLSFVASCFLLIATSPFCCRASDLSFSNAGFNCAISPLTTLIFSFSVAFSC